MKSFINKKFVILENKIFKKVKNSTINELSSKILINYLIYLTLKTEKLIFTKNFNPEQEIFNDIKYLKSIVGHIVSFKEFSHKKKFIQNFNLEQNHKSLFQKLWINYTFDEFKKERLGRYTKRIKINKIQGLIKNKRIVDFGCGHGNFLMSMLKFKPTCLGLIMEKNQFNMQIDIGKDFPNIIFHF